jgi:hypothetical protein
MTTDEVVDFSNSKIFQNQKSKMVPQFDLSWAQDLAITDRP